MCYWCIYFAFVIINAIILYVLWRNKVIGNDEVTIEDFMGAVVISLISLVSTIMIVVWFVVSFFEQHFEGKVIFRRK